MEHSPRYRVTLRFTDQQGNRRWLTQTAPGAARAVAEPARDLPAALRRQRIRRAERTLVVDLADLVVAVLCALASTP